MSFRVQVHSNEQNINSVKTEIILIGAKEVNLFIVNKTTGSISEIQMARINEVTLIPWEGRENEKSKGFQFGVTVSKGFHSLVWLFA